MAGPVHTPPEHHGHGYGATATAAALINPTSNRLYPRVGFVPVADHREVRLGERL